MEKELFFKRMPKIDLHRHLEGSLRLGTLQEVAGEYFPELLSTLNQTVQVLPSEPATPENFLAKFRTLRNFYLSLDLIKRFVYECVEDAANDGLVYLELRFCPSALSHFRPDLLPEVIASVVNSAQQASRQFDLPLRLLVCLNRHEPLELAEHIVSNMWPFLSEGIAGVDLAGDELNFSALPFQNLLLDAKNRGLALTVHAGEWGGAENVSEAMNILKANRIGHGVRILESEDAVAEAVDQQIPLEVCLTSNIQSGVYSSLKKHPINKMLEAGLNVTINSDDPQISRITLSSELQLLKQQFGLSLDHIFQAQLASIAASFLPAQHQEKIRTCFVQRFNIWREQSLLHEDEDTNLMC